MSTSQPLNRAENPALITTSCGGRRGAIPLAFATLLASPTHDAERRWRRDIGRVWIPLALVWCVLVVWAYAVARSI